MQTYLFYDIETTGLNKSFDQVLHFAAIRTDLFFHELSRHEFIVKLNPDVVPSPEAMMTHGMSLTDIENGLSEYEAIQQIHALLNTPGTISLGYNTLGFDDSFLRFSFYRNLFSPYTHQYANNCRRMDIYPLAILYYLYKPEVLTWPEVEGKVSFKLSDLNVANQFSTKASHHAMADVEMTIALAKKLSQAGAMWDYVGRFFRKDTEQLHVSKLQSDCGLMILGKFGTAQAFQSQVLSLGNHYHYKNQWLWLRLDDKDFSTIEKEHLPTSTYVMRKKWGEPGFLLPLWPRYLHHLNDERLQLAAKNKQWLHDHPDLFRLIADYHLGFKYPVYPNIDADASLYQQGFWTYEEEAYCREFHAASPQEKSRLAERMSHHPILYALSVRILGRHFREALNEKQAGLFENYLDEIKRGEGGVDYRGRGRLTVEGQLMQANKLAIATL